MATQNHYLIKWLKDSGEAEFHVTAAYTPQFEIVLIADAIHHGYLELDDMDKNSVTYTLSEIGKIVTGFYDDTPDTTPADLGLEAARMEGRTPPAPDTANETEALRQRVAQLNRGVILETIERQKVEERNRHLRERVAELEADNNALSELRHDLLIERHHHKARIEHLEAAIHNAFAKLSEARDLQYDMKYLAADNRMKVAKNYLNSALHSTQNSASDDEADS